MIIKIKKRVKRLPRSITGLIKKNKSAPRIRGTITVPIRAGPYGIAMFKLYRYIYCLENNVS